MKPVPIYSTRVLWQTSLWMLIPAYLSEDFMFTCSIRLTLIFSMLHWYYYHMGSVYQALDRMFSCLTIMILCVRSDTLVPLVPVITSFGIGHYYHRNDCFGQHLMYHVLFRALAFLWCCHYCNHVNFILWLFYVILYVLQVCYVLLNSVL